jgi:hypothetical protein
VERGERKAKLRGGGRNKWREEETISGDEKGIIHNRRRRYHLEIYWTLFYIPRFFRPIKT